jgi:hypothetical protein
MEYLVLTGAVTLHHVGLCCAYLGYSRCALTTAAQPEAGTLMASKAEGSAGAPKPSTAAPSLLSGAFNAGGGGGVKMPGRARCTAARVAP